MYFCYFEIISPRKKVGPFIWTNLTPLHPRMPSPKFGWNWLSGYGEDIFVSWSSMYFRYFVFTPLGKGRGPSFEQTWIPFPQGCFVPSLVEIRPVVLEKKMKDNGQILFRKAHLSLRLSWAKKQEAHGPYPPEKPNTFEKSYDYITTWIRRGKIPLSPFKELNGPYL